MESVRLILWRGMMGYSRAHKINAWENSAESDLAGAYGILMLALDSGNLEELVSDQAQARSYIVHRLDELQ
jgi:hypothetical protein